MAATLSPTVSGVSADAALRKAGVPCRMAGKIPGGDVRALVSPATVAEAVRVLAARFPAAHVFEEDSYTVRIHP